MESTQSVLITFSVIVDAPVQFEARERVLDRVSEQLAQATRGLGSKDPSIHATEGFSYHYLGDEEENARRCDQCGAWTTDTTRPGVIDSLKQGKPVAGGFLCDECAKWGHDRGNTL